MSKDLNNEEKLEAIYEMTLENNDILRTIRRQQYFANGMRILYWLVVLGAIGSTYYFVRPLVSTFTDNSGKMEEAYTQLRSQLPETKLIEQVVSGMKGKKVAPSDATVIEESSTTVR